MSRSVERLLQGGYTAFVVDEMENDAVTRDVARSNGNAVSLNRIKTLCEARRTLIRRTRR